MVAPSLTVSQTHADLTSTNFTFAANIRTDIVDAGNSVISQSADEFSFNGSVVFEDEYYVEIIFPSFDATNTIWNMSFFTAPVANEGVFGLGSGVGNYRMWSPSSGDGFWVGSRVADIHIDTSVATTIADTGTFNITAVDRIRLKFTAVNNTTSNTIFRLEGAPYYYLANAGVQLVNGDSGNPLDLDSAYDLLLARLPNVDATSTTHLTYLDKVGTNLLRNPIGIVWGDFNTTHVADGLVAHLFSLSPINNTTFRFTYSNLLKTYFSVGFSGLSIPPKNWINDGLSFDWADNGGGNTWASQFWDGPGAVSLGTSDYTGAVINAGTGLVTGGVNAAIELINCTNTTTYEWTQNSDLSYPNLSGSTFNSPAANYYINVPSTVPDGATLDISGVTFTSNPLTKKIRCDIGAGKTLNLNVGSTSVSLSDVEIVSGSVNLIVDQVTFSASSLATTDFNNVHCRLSLVPGGPVKLSDSNSVTSGGNSFVAADVNTTNNTITITGITGKITTGTLVRLYGDNPPAFTGITSQQAKTKLFYVAGTYAGDDNVILSGSPGGTALDITDAGSGTMYLSAWSELDTQLITSGSYEVALNTAATTAGLTLANNDILVLQAVHYPATDTGGTGLVLSEYLEESFLYQGLDISSLSTLTRAEFAETFLAEFGIGGSEVTGIAPDASSPANVQIDITRTTLDTRELVAYFYYYRHQLAGLRTLGDNVDIVGLNRIEIRGELTLDPASDCSVGGPYAARKDTKNLRALGSPGDLYYDWEDTRASQTIVEVPVDLSPEIKNAIESILFMVSRLSGGSGGGDDAATIYTYFTASNRQDTFKATGFATPADIPTADITAILEDTGTTLPAAIGAIPTNPLTALPTIPTNWITADGIAPDAIAEIQNGLSTFNNLTDQVVASNMRGTDNALTSIDLSSLALETSVQSCLGFVRPMAKQLGLVAGITATHSDTAITVSDADGSTTITDNGDGSYTVQSA